MKQPTVEELCILNKALGKAYYDDGVCPERDFAALVHFFFLTQLEDKCFALFMLLGQLAEEAMHGEVNALLDESSEVDLFRMITALTRIYEKLDGDKRGRQSNRR